MVSFVFFTLVAIPILMGLALWLDTWLKRRLLRCYAAPWNVGQRKGYLILCTVAVASLLQGVLVPLAVVPFFPSARYDYNLLTVVWGLVGIVIFLGWSIIVYRWWHTYGDRCPQNLDHRIAGPYQFGRRCPVCNTALTGWLELPNAPVVSSGNESNIRTESTGQANGSVQFTHEQATHIDDKHDGSDGEEAK